MRPKKYITKKRTMDEIIAVGEKAAAATRASVRCVNDSSNAVKTSYKDGGVPLCSRCLKKSAMTNPEEFVASTRAHLKGRGTRRAFLPFGMVEFYDEAYLDDDLISLREDLATYEARIMSLTRQIRDDPRNSLPWATTLDKMMKQMKGAVKRGALTWANAFKQIEDFMAGPVTERLVWAEVNLATDMKRKLAIAEAKRMHDIGWTPEAVMKGIEDIAGIVRNLKLDEEMIKFFMEQLAESALFTNPHMKLLNQLQLTSTSTEEQLLALEIVHTHKKNGVYAPVSTKKPRKMRSSDSLKGHYDTNKDGETNGTS